MSVCPCVCVFVPSRLMVEYVQRGGVLSFCHKINCINNNKNGLLIVKGNTNCTIDSSVTVVLDMQSAFLHPFYECLISPIM